MQQIIERFPITGEEYDNLRDEFELLCYKAAQELKRKNSRNNLIDDIDDVMQELSLSLIRAGSYYKRWVYIESCLRVCKEFIKDKFVFSILSELEDLWNKRTRHGANRQKFGPFQELLLEQITYKFVPYPHRPNKSAKLVISDKFSRYCKAIIWNQNKSMGRKITREKPIRSGLVSLSDYSYLGTL